MRQLAIFGGTFDPVHWGHLILAEAALHQVPLEQVIWVPSFNPPYKQAATFEHRLEMVLQAIADNPKFAVSLVEQSHPVSSFAINTLINLSADHPDTHWYWIIGLDAFQTLPRWYRGQELAQLCEWLIAPRLLSGETITQSEIICKQVVQKLTKQTFNIHWQLLNIPFVGLSSSLIRNMYNDGRSIRYLVPETVRAYIDNHNLYTNG